MRSHMQESSNSSGESSADPNPEEWLDLYGDSLYQFALARVRNPSTAEDLVQETFLAGMRAISSFEGRSSLKSWLIAILKNKIIDHLRKASRQKEEVFEEETIDLPVRGFSSIGIWNVYVPNWAGSPEGVLENQQFMEVIKNCFEKLPDRSRRLFQLKLLQDLDTEEICKLLEISSSNYWVLVHRARLALRECVESNWYRKS